MPSLRPHTTPRLAAALLLIVTIGFGAIPSDADLADDIRKLREEQRQIQESKQEKAAEIDKATATANELADALGALNTQVNQQEERLIAADTERQAAVQRYADATQAVVDKVAEIESLENQVSHRAISAFVGQNLAGAPVLDGSDPNQAVRKQAFVRSITDRDFDVAEQLMVAREDLGIEQARADAAADEAERLRAQIEADLVALQGVRDSQAELAAEAEERLERQLAEAAVLAERDQELAAEITEKNAELQRQAELARRRRNPAPTSQSNPKFPTADEITQVDVFWVHIDIEDNLRDMLAHAARDGVILKGWGYRDHSSQIRLRRQHCGTSNYAIYQMPSSQCRPPTARPGRSQHELGLAIDFTLNGKAINTRSSAGYKWLAQNAGAYGFKNLPSEPWHWSTTGN